MSKRLDVLTAVATLLATAVDGAEFVGFDDPGAQDSVRVPAGGRVVMGRGDPGKPDVDLSPPIYWWRHAIPITVERYAEDGLTGDEAVDEVLRRIDTAVAADRTLGGLAIYLETTSPQDEDAFVEGAEPPVAVSIDVIATYSTTSPLG